MILITYYEKFCFFRSAESEEEEREEASETLYSKHYLYHIVFILEIQMRIDIELECSKSFCSEVSVA